MAATLRSVPHHSTHGDKSEGGGRRVDLRFPPDISRARQTAVGCSYGTVVNSPTQTINHFVIGDYIGPDTSTQDFGEFSLGVLEIESEEVNDGFRTVGSN